jgi:hypothetical protein
MQLQPFNSSQDIINHFTGQAGVFNKKDLIKNSF